METSSHRTWASSRLRSRVARRPVCSRARAVRQWRRPPVWPRSPGCQITGTAAAGTYTLVATRSGLTPTDTSTNVVINVGAANKLAFTTQPVGGVAEGVALATQPVVTVQDSYGNTVTSDTGNVTLAIAAGPAAGSLGCTSTTVAAVAGRGDVHELPDHRHGGRGHVHARCDALRSHFDRLVEQRRHQRRRGEQARVHDPAGRRRQPRAWCSRRRRWSRCRTPTATPSRATPGT